MYGLNLYCEDLQMLYGQINPHNLCVGDGKYCLHLMEWKMEPSKGFGLSPVSKLKREREEKKHLKPAASSVTKLGSHLEGKL